MSSSALRFDNSYARLPERFFRPSRPARVPAPALVRLNAPLAIELDLDPVWLASEDGVAMLAGNALPEGTTPIAQAYAGHQFGGFVPQLGDGRAILVGEVIDVHGQRRDLQLKGAGRTAFSRGGDGKAALGPVLREFILSEAMAALGVPTTRALAAVTTGERILRAEGMLAGAVFTRVAASHIRVGTFEYFRARDDREALQLLADTAIARHYPELAAASHRYRAFFEAVATRQADLIAQWLSIGFIHGVMNTDNTAISGETIDYGPCAFMDAFDPEQVFSSIDTYGRYAWNKQPDIGLWNLARFAESLLPLLSADQSDAIAFAEAALGRYRERCAAQYESRFRAKLGLAPEGSTALIQECLELLAAQSIDFTVFFRRLTQVVGGDDVRPLKAMFADSAPLEAWLDAWQREGHATERLAMMRGANPVLIPRNHRVEEAIQHGYSGNFGPFHRLVDALATPYEDRAEYADLEKPPQPEEIVQRTFCGT